MLNIQFQQLALINFATYEEEAFDIGALATGLHQLQGRNEFQPNLGQNDCGKTTLFRALSWCLFGKTIDGLRNPDIQPWGQKTTTEVSLKLQIYDNLKEITRTANPNKLLLNDKEVGQETIEKLLGFGFEIFSNTIVLGQGQPLFFDLRPSDKMRLLSDALGLDRWLERSKTASARTDALQTEHVKLQGTIAGLESSLETIKPLIADNAKRAKSFESDRLERLSSARTKTLELEKELADKARRRDAAELSYDEAATEAKAAEKETEQLSRQAYDLVFTCESAKRDTKRLETELASLAKAKKCPTCGQDIKPKNLVQHVSELNKLIAETEAKGLKADKQLTPINKKLEHAKKVYEQFDKKSDNAQSAYKIHNEACQRLELQIAPLKQTIKDLEAGHNPYQEQLRTLKRKETMLVSDLAIEQKRLLQLEAELALTKFWIKGFKDVQLYIIEEFLQELELVTNAMLIDMGLDDWSIQYAVEKETQSGTLQRGLNVIIISPSNNKPVKWESWGGGVGQSLRLVGALALSDGLLNHAGIDIDLEVLDEPLKYLSKERVRDCLPFLAERAKINKKRIILVEHSVIPSSSFTSTLIAVKSKEGISQLIT